MSSGSRQRRRALRATFPPRRAPTSPLRLPVPPRPPRSRPQIPNQRFGAAFQGRVANPADLLLFWRKPVVKSKADKEKAAALAAAGGGDAVVPREMPAEAVRLADLVSRELAGAKLKVRSMCVPGRMLSVTLIRGE